MTHLLRIHIGPVQEFIAAARRSRDLWFGSWLLSELSKSAALAVARAEPGSLEALVFPAPADWPDLQPGSPLNVANEIVAVITHPPATVAQAARDAVDVRRDTLVSETFSTLRGKLGAERWEVAEAQLKEFVEFYWVTVPLAGGKYHEARALADRLLAARKNTRDFSPVRWKDHTWPKSSLDGMREAVNNKEEAKDATLMYARYRGRRGEHLSGVDLLKRLGNAGDESRFPSTSHMAAMPLKKQLEDNAAAVENWNQYLAVLPPRVKDQEQAWHALKLPVLEEYDGSLLFASRLLDHLEGAALKTAEQALRAFFKTADIPEPNPYYALLIGDGDFMGRTINRLDTPEKNRQFSLALAGFAAEARAIVGRHDGAVVYAGGDDVLALLPVHTAVPCAAELARIFEETLKPFGAAGESPTFSAGVAIVHHLEPLEDALALARDAEKAAKSVPDGKKNALAVVLDKRGGTPRLVAGKWGTLDRRLLNLAALHQAGLIPDGLAYQLLDGYHLLGGQKAMKTHPALQPILALEAERIIDRKRVEGGQGAVDLAHRAYVKQAVTDPNTTIAAMADELVIASLLARVNALAGETYPFVEQEATPA